MDSLCSDLQQSISNLLKVSQSVWIGLQTKDNEQYLDLVSNIDRYKLALKENNIGWIHETIDGLPANDRHIIASKAAIKYKRYTWLLEYLYPKFISDPIKRPPTDMYLSHLYITNQFRKLGILLNNGYKISYYPYYYHGLRGDDFSQVKIQYLRDTDLRIGMICYLDGLSRSENYKLFDKYYGQVDRDTLCNIDYEHSHCIYAVKIGTSYQQYAQNETPRILVDFIINNFKDEDEIISRLKCISNYNPHINSAHFKAKKFKVIEYLLQFLNTPMQYLVQLFIEHNKTSMIDSPKFRAHIKTYEPETLKSFYKIACYTNSIESLKFLDSLNLKNIYGNQYCVSNEVHAYYNKKQPSVLQKDLYKIYEFVKPYLIHFDCIGRTYNHSTFLRVHDYFLYILSESVSACIYGSKKLSEIKKIVADIASCKLVDIKTILKYYYSIPVASPILGYLSILSRMNILELRSEAHRIGIHNYTEMFESELVLNIVLSL